MPRPACGTCTRSPCTSCSRSCSVVANRCFSPRRWRWRSGRRRIRSRAVNRVSILQNYLYFVLGATRPHLMLQVAVSQRRHLVVSLALSYAVAVGLLWVLEVPRGPMTLLLSGVAVPLAIRCSVSLSRWRAGGGAIAWVGRRTLPDLRPARAADCAADAAAEPAAGGERRGSSIGGGGRNGLPGGRDGVGRRGLPARAGSAREVRPRVAVPAPAGVRCRPARPRTQRSGPGDLCGRAARATTTRWPAAYRFVGPPPSVRTRRCAPPARGLHRPRRRPLAAAPVHRPTGSTTLSSVTRGLRRIAPGPLRVIRALLRVLEDGSCLSLGIIRRARSVLLGQSRGAPLDVLLGRTVRHGHHSRSEDDARCGHHGPLGRAGRAGAGPPVGRDAGDRDDGQRAPG